MSYQAKKDWQYDEVVTEQDMNRIESGIEGNQQGLSTHVAEDAKDAHMGKNIGIEDVAGNFTAKDIEGAMSELFTNVSDGKRIIGGAIADVDESVVIPTNPSFNDLATGIGQISTGKKWASGEISINNREETKIVLDFNPSYVSFSYDNYAVQKGIVGNINHYFVSYGAIEALCTLSGNTLTFYQDTSSSAIHVKWYVLE